MFTIDFGFGLADVIWRSFYGQESSRRGGMDSIGGRFEGGESEEQQSDEEEENTDGDGGLGSGNNSLRSSASSSTGFQ